jgi:uncharacterized BrkB/YihY/UPF0761 family membrane protein
MPSISVRATILANLASLAVVTVTLSGMLLFTTVLMAAADGRDTNSVMDEVVASRTILALTVAVVLLACILSGYVAARMAKRAELLHGALSTAIVIGLNCWGFAFESGDNYLVGPTADFLIGWSAPLFGMLGAYFVTMRGAPRMA